MKLTTTSAQEITHVNALVYGDSGCGKTTSIKTLNPEFTLVANCERGTLPLRSMDFARLDLETFDDLRELCRLFKNPDGIDDKKLQAIVQRTKTLVLDSLSEVNELGATEIIKKSRLTVLAERDKSGNKDKKHEAAIGAYADILTLEEYNVHRVRVSNFLRALGQLPVNVVVTCRAGWFKDEVAGETLRAPNMYGRMATEAPAHFDLVFHMESATSFRTSDGDGGSKRVWRTERTNRIIAKDASGVLDKFEETDWGKVFKKILGNGKKTETKE